MRVAIAGDFAEDPHTIVGGIQAVIYYTLTALAAYPNLELHIVSCEKNSRASAENRPRHLTFPGWQAHHLPSPPHLSLTRTMLTADRRAVARCLRDLQPDLIHAHGQVAAYPWAAFSVGRPTIITVHGINYLEAAIDPRGARWQAWLRRTLWGQIERACLRRAQDIVIISPFVASIVRPLTRARLHAIENPVEARLFDLPRRPTAPARILYVGSIQKRKGLADLIAALGQVRAAGLDAEVRVAGAFMSTYADYGAAVRQLVAQLGLSDHVHFLGHLDRDALLAEYAACSLFCLPSYLEASPVVVAEAMAAGCPIVTTAIPSTTHLIHPGVTGLRTPPGDVTALTDALLAILRQPDEAHRLGAAARQVAQQRFSPAQAAAALYALYAARLDQTQMA